MPRINPAAMLPVSGIPRLFPTVDELLSVGNALVVVFATIVLTMAST
jgi:hypothetical protein